VQKVCLWGSPTPVAPNSSNDDQWHYWWLTLTHEFGHALSLPHRQPQQCVMLDGLDMEHPCAAEANWVNQHYGF
jgi:hypothetical protein